MIDDGGSWLSRLGRCVGDGADGGCVGGCNAVMVDLVAQVVFLV